MMAVLTQYGPTANERVASHLAALEVLLEAEREAWRRYATNAPPMPQKPLPVVLPEDDEETPPNVRSLGVARLARQES